MKSRLSQMVDGELEQEQISAILAKVREDHELRTSWRLYHLIGDALRHDPVTGPDVVQKVSLRLEAEQGRCCIGQKKWQAANAVLLLLLIIAIGYFFYSVHHLPDSRPPHATSPNAVLGEYGLAHDDGAASATWANTSRITHPQDFLANDPR